MIRPNSAWRKALYAIAFCLLLAGCLFVFRAPLLTALGRAWVVDEPVAQADAIVILGGGLENRPFAAAKMFRAGIAPRLLYMNVRPSPAEQLGVALAEAEQTHRILLSNGVPDSALTLIGNGVGSTYDEACAVRDWAKSVGAKSILIPTDLFHTRRVRWLFQKQFRDTATEIHVQAVDPLRYQTTNWWLHEEGLIAFQNEVIKFVYYHLKY